MNYKKDDAGHVILNIDDAVAYYRINTGKKMTPKRMMEILFPDYAPAYRSQLCTHWRKGSPKFRPSNSQVEKIRFFTGLPIEKLVKQL